MQVLISFPIMFIAVETFDIMLSEFQAIVKAKEASSDQSRDDDDADDEAIKRLLMQQRFSAALSLLLRVPNVQSFKSGAATRAMNALLTCHHPFIGMFLVIAQKYFGY